MPIDKLLRAVEIEVAPPRRGYRCPESGTQCCDCSRSAHQQEVQDEERWQRAQTTS